jgi:predicted RNA-binding Zn ribbon-like protein
MIQSEPRTSNGIESWHCQLSNSVQAAHPTIWKLIEDLKNEIVLAEQKIDRFNATGNTPRRNKTYQWRDTNLKNCILRYGEINVFDFLKSMAHLIRLDKNVAGEENGM